MIEFQKLLYQQVEFRLDPLTGAQTRINPARAKRAKHAAFREGDLEQLVEASRLNCPFCPGKVEVETPLFPEDICETGRISIGESLLFPNLNPFGEQHVVGTICRNHFLKLSEFTPDMVRDNLLATKRYIASVHARNREARYPVYMWNYLPPSAGSIIHPHVQILLESEPTPQLAVLMAKSSDYYRSTGQNYWATLVEQERKLGERLITGDDLISVLASFAPCGFNEVCFIFHGISSLAQLDESRIETFSHRLTMVLRAYEGMGIGSFNLCTLSGPIDEDFSNSYWMSARLISRPYPRGIYTNDSGPMERMQGVWVIDTLPEELARKMESAFQSQGR
jgi:galactose-1-phosphate uridylyltransferase